MKKRNAVCLALAGLMTASLVGMTACGEKKGENELWITFFNGGYGSDWAYQLAEKFEAEHEGVTVHLGPDTQLINSVSSLMQNGTDYDIIFCHDIPWEDYVAPGYIYCLDDLFATEVSSGVTFADRIWDEDVLDSCRYPGADGKEHYYKVPWTIGTAGIAFNVTVMNRIDTWLATEAGQSYLATQEGGGDTSRRWKETPPVTYYDLWQYCVDISTAKLRATEGDKDSAIIVPFTWSGQAEEYQWDYSVFDWWGQLAGPETMNTFKNFGNVTENFEIDWSNTSNPSSDVFDPSRHAVTKNADGTVNTTASDYIGWAEFKEAYTLWYNLVALNKDWSDSKVGSYSKFENEQAFANGLAAMTPAACWIEYESRDYLAISQQEVSIMPTPTISNVKLDANGRVVLPYESGYASAPTTLDAIRASEESNGTITVTGANGEKLVYNRVSFTSSFGDSVMIPASASSKELAVQFILFMQEEENAKLFTRVSGGTVLPYKYEYWNSFVDANGVDQASKWQKAVFDIDRNSVKFNNYTKHPMMRNTELKGSAVMTTIWPGNLYYYLKAWNTPDAYAPDTLIDQTVYAKYVLAGWNTFKKEM